MHGKRSRSSKRAKISDIKQKACFGGLGAASYSSNNSNRRKLRRMVTQTLCIHWSMIKSARTIRYRKEINRVSKEESLIVIGRRQGHDEQCWHSQTQALEAKAECKSAVYHLACWN